MYGTDTYAGGDNVNDRETTFFQLLPYPLKII